MTTTAKIAAKGCQSTGITEDLAATLHDNLGRKVLAVVELVSEARSEKRSGDEAVVLSILTIEPAPTTDTENHLRELARAFHYERKLTESGPQLQIPGDSPEPTVDEVTKAGARHRPHPYLASTLSTDDNAACDVCGLTETAPLHSTQDTLPDPFTVPEQQADDTDDDVDADPDDPTFEDHDFIDDGDGTCVECNQAEDSAVHTAALATT